MNKKIFDLDDAIVILDKTDIELLRNGIGSEKFSLEIKKIIVLCIGLIVPCTFEIVFIPSYTNGSSANISYLIGIISELIIITLMFYHFFQVNKSSLTYWAYKKYVYSIAKLSYISYFSAAYGMDTGNYMITLLVITSCIITFNLLYFFVERNLILEEVNKLFNKKYKTSKIAPIMLKFSGILLGVIFVVMQFYRLNKSWLMNLIGDNKIFSINSSIDDLVGIFIGIPMLLMITLIPTYFLFHADVYVKGKMITNHSEDFRKKYGYSEKEWYKNNN